MNRKVDHINMKVPNLEAAITYYCQELGFTQVARFDNGAGFVAVYLQNEGVMYEFFENPALTSAVVDHIAYTSEDIQADHAYFEAKGDHPTPIGHVPFMWERGVDYFFIEGPAGEKVEILKKR